MKVAVYFNSGYKAVFDVEGVDFRGGKDVPSYGAYDYQGKALVNWENVCFVRELPEENNDDDE